jgi:uncharacterized protein YndB with AHSA1/START domain
MTTAANRDSAATLEPAAMSDTSDRELVAVRLFDAPRPLVFQAWTEPDHIANWWGPRGFTTTTYTMDVRPGGVWRLCMHGPDGRDYQNKITYLEVVPPERIVYQHGGDEPELEKASHTVTVTFDDECGKTRMTMRMVFPSAKAMAFIVEKYGADKGLQETVDRLGEYAASLAKPKAKALKVELPSDREIRLTRVFNAPRALVYEALTRPEHLARWWGPHGTTINECEMDVRPGGAWRIKATVHGQICPMKGVFREVLPPERLVRTSIYDVDVIREMESVETLTLTEHDGKTTLQVLVLHQSKEARDGHVGAGLEWGAGQSYDRLEELLKTMA